MKRREERSALVARLFDAAMREAWPRGVTGAAPAVERARDEALALVMTEKERRQVDRRAAEVLLLIACATPATWDQVRRAWGRVEHLGFATVDRRIQNALLLARWCINNRSHGEVALRALEAARARLRRLPRNSSLRAALQPRLESFMEQLHQSSMDHGQ